MQEKRPKGTVMKALQEIKKLNPNTYKVGPATIKAAQACQEQLYTNMLERYEDSGAKRVFGNKRLPVGYPAHFEDFMVGFTGFVFELTCVAHLGYSHHQWVDIRLPKYKADPDRDEHMPDILPNFECKTSFIDDSEWNYNRPGIKADDQIFLMGSVQMMDDGHAVVTVSGWLPGHEVRSRCKREVWGSKVVWTWKLDNLNSMDTLDAYINQPATLPEEFKIG
jgi:hypothetical protein